MPVTHGYSVLRSIVLDMTFFFFGTCLKVSNVYVLAAHNAEHLHEWLPSFVICFGGGFRGGPDGGEGLCIRGQLRLN